MRLDDEYSNHLQFFVFENLLLYWFLSYNLTPKIKDVANTKNKPRESSKWHVALVLFNQTLVTFLALHFFNIQEVMKKNFRSQQVQNYPFSAPCFVVLNSCKIFLCYLVQCLLFYLVHRLLHQRQMYKWIHSVHHQYKHPVPWTAFYCHPVEHFFANLFPVFAGPIFFDLSFVMFRFWVMLATVNAVFAHTSFKKLAHCDMTNPHRVHHLKYRVNFGTGFWLDKYLGTEEKEN